MSLVRRLTGGRAVLHHREVTYSVTGPVVRSDTLRTSYAAINQILLAALQRLGINHCCGGHLTLRAAAAAAGVELQTVLEALP